MPLNDNATQCTARSKNSQERCLNPAVQGFRVCRMHGAGTHKRGRYGGSKPKHGLYSKKFKLRLGELADQIKTDPDMVNIDEYIAIQTLMVGRMLEDMENTANEEDDAGKKMGDIAAARLFYKSVMQGMDSIQKGLERRQRILESKKYTMQVDEVRALIRKLLDIINDEIADDETRRRITARCRTLSIAPAVRAS